MLRLVHIRAEAAPAFDRKECLQRYRHKKQRRHFSHKVRLPCIASAMPYSAPLHALPTCWLASKEQPLCAEGPPQIFDCQRITCLSGMCSSRST